MGANNLESRSHAQNKLVQILRSKQQLNVLKKLGGGRREHLSSREKNKKIERYDHSMLRSLPFNRVCEEWAEEWAVGADTPSNSKYSCV